MTAIIDYFKRKYEASKMTDFNKNLYLSAYASYKKVKKHINIESIIADYNSSLADMSSEQKATLSKIDLLLNNLASPNNSNKTHNENAKELNQLLDDISSDFGYNVENKLRFDIVKGKLIAYYQKDGHIFAFSYSDSKYLGLAFRKSNFGLEKRLRFDMPEYAYSTSSEYIFDEHGQETLTKNNIMAKWYGSARKDTLGYLTSVVHNLSTFTLDSGKSMDKVELMSTEYSNVFKIVVSKIIKSRNADGYDSLCLDPNAPVLSALVDFANGMRPIIINNTIFYGEPLISQENNAEAIICLNEIVQNPTHIREMQDKVQAYSAQIKKNGEIIQQNLGLVARTLNFNLNREKILNM